MTIIGGVSLRYHSKKKEKDQRNIDVSIADYTSKGYLNWTRTHHLHFKAVMRRREEQEELTICDHTLITALLTNGPSRREAKCW